MIKMLIILKKLRVSSFQILSLYKDMIQTKNSESPANLPEQNKQPIKKKADPRQMSQDFFKVATILVVIAVYFALTDIGTFRSQNTSNNINIVSVQTIALWTSIGFIFSITTRLLFQKYFGQWINPRLNSRFQGLDEYSRMYKSKIVAKQFYEGFYHLFMSIYAFVLFRKEYWFPTIAGGCGACDQIFKEFPYWPTNYGREIQIFYLFQLGTNLYLLLELVTFKRQFYKTRNFYELFFHHVTTITLIIVSMAYNFSAVGAIIMFLHDFSDLFRAFHKFVQQTRYSSDYETFYDILEYSYILIWSYMRIIAFPFCVIQAELDFVYPVTGYQYLDYECNYMRVLSCGIFFLQSYWVFFLFSNRYERNKMKKEIQANKESKIKQAEQKEKKAQ